MHKKIFSTVLLAAPFAVIAAPADDPYQEQTQEEQATQEPVAQETQTQDATAQPISQDMETESQDATAEPVSQENIGAEDEATQPISTEDPMSQDPMTQEPVSQETETQSQEMSTQPISQDTQSQQQSQQQAGQMQQGGDAGGEPTIERAQFTSEVQDREPVDEASEFQASQDPLYFFTEVKDGQGETITHVWKRDGETIAEVPLEVGSDSWRTWSSKEMMPDWEGEFTVEVVDSQGNTLTEESINVQASEQTQNVGYSPDEGAQQDQSQQQDQGLQQDDWQTEGVSEETTTTEEDDWQTQGAAAEGTQDDLQTEDVGLEEEATGDETAQDEGRAGDDQDDWR